MHSSKNLGLKGQLDNEEIPAFAGMKCTLGIA